VESGQAQHVEDEFRMLTIRFFSFFVTLFLLESEKSSSVSSSLFSLESEKSSSVLPSVSSSRERFVMIMNAQYSRTKILKNLRCQVGATIGATPHVINGITRRKTTTRSHTLHEKLTSFFILHRV
jgi:uncharacterized protein Veg